MLAVLTLDAAVAARSGHGGTAPDRVREQIARYRDWLAGFRSWSAQVVGMSLSAAPAERGLAEIAGSEHRAASASTGAGSLRP